MFFSGCAIAEAVENMKIAANINFFIIIPIF
jgi:hypothetical protein